MSLYSSFDRSMWIRPALFTSLGILGTGVAGLVVYGFILSTNLALPKSDEHPPLLIYGAPFALTPGLSVERSGLFERLHRLEYRRVHTEPKAAGEYALTADGIDLDFPVRMHDDMDGRFHRAEMVSRMEPSVWLCRWTA